MKISFLGTGASEGVPAMFCSCKNCQTIRNAGIKQFHTRSQVVIDDILSVDFPPEAYIHSLAYNVDLSALKYLLVTHSHMDHFYAHDFVLRGYKYAELKEGLLQIYGNEEICKVFNECTARELKREVSEHLVVNLLHSYRSLQIGDFRVITVPACHKTEEEALLFYIEREGKGYLHLYDTGDLSDAAIDFLAQNGAKASLIAFDCTFLDAPHRDGVRHMCISDNMVIFEKLKRAGVACENTIKVITHFSHNSNPTDERLKELEERYGVVAAHDGMTIEI